MKKTINCALQFVRATEGLQFPTPMSETQRKRQICMYTCVAWCHCRSAQMYRSWAAAQCLSKPKLRQCKHWTHANVLKHLKTSSLTFSRFLSLSFSLSKEKQQSKKLIFSQILMIGPALKPGWKNILENKEIRMKEHCPQSHHPFASNTGLGGLMIDVIHWLRLSHKDVPDTQPLRWSLQRKMHQDTPRYTKICFRCTSNALDHFIQVDSTYSTGNALKTCLQSQILSLEVICLHKVQQGGAGAILSLWF